MATWRNKEGIGDGKHGGRKTGNGRNGGRKWAAEAMEKENGENGLLGKAKAGKNYCLQVVQKKDDA